MNIKNLLGKQKKSHILPLEEKTTGGLPTISSMLITNTMIRQAAYFVNDPIMGVPSRIEAFFDLCCLIEAVILRKNLFTLEGEINDSRYPSLSLLTSLKKERILIENAIPLDIAGIKRELITVVGTDRVFNDLKVRGVSIRIVDMLPDIFPDEANPQLAVQNNPKQNRDRYMWEIRSPYDARPINGSMNVFQFFREDNFIEFLRGTGDQERGAYILRTYLYTQTARKQCISFMPDYPRIPFLASILDQYYTNVVENSYNTLARKLQLEAEDFLEDARPLGLPIPPFSSLVLNECSSNDDIIKVLLEIRDEFSELRENLAYLEDKLINSSNIGERNKAREHTKAVFTAASSKYSDSSYANFTRLFDFSGDLIAPAFNWANPTSYSASLVTKPVEWLRNWWLRKPLAQFFDLTRQFRSIKDYNLLARKVFNIEFSNDEIEDFRKTQVTLANMFDTKRKPGGDTL
jgi:hypothetical protein